MSHEGWARRRTTAIVPFYWNRADIGRKSAKTLSSCRLDLNTKQLAERRTAVGIAQLDDPIRPGFEPATRVVDELHFENELLDGGLAELAQDLAVGDSLSHHPIIKAFRFS